MVSLMHMVRGLLLPGKPMECSNAALDAPKGCVCVSASDAGQ